LQSLSPSAKSACKISRASASHVRVERNLRQGDPTPLKSFRYREYECPSRAWTSCRMTRVLNYWDEITLTREVADAAFEPASAARFCSASDKRRSFVASL
jgi:hypothetical protein